MLTLVDIVNISLGYLNVTLIENLDDESDISKKILLQLKITKARTLKDFSWGFALKELNLDILPKFDNKFYFLPADWIGASFPKIKEQRSFLNPSTNTQSILISFVEEKCDFQKTPVYIYDAPDTVFSPEYQDYLAHYLAYDLSLTFAKDPALRALLRQEIELAKNEIRRKQNLELVSSVISTCYAY